MSDVIQSPIASSLRAGHQPDWRGLREQGKETLFWNHPPLMKWDFDLFENNGRSTGHEAYKTTITDREEPRQIIAAHPWARNHVWAFFDSWGGVNAYCLTQPMSLGRLSEAEIAHLIQVMRECRVDPTYIMNLVNLQLNPWDWCSRVWKKPWRLGEEYVGILKYYWGLEEEILNSIDRHLEKTLWDIVGMYDVHNRRSTNKNPLIIIG